MFTVLVVNKPRGVFAVGENKVKSRADQDMRLGSTPLPLAVAARSAFAVQKRGGYQNSTLEFCI